MAVERVAIPILDRLKCNKVELAKAFDVSVAAVDAWLRRGCPFVQRGNLGKAWIFDVIQVAEWRFGAKDAPQEQDPDKLTPKERLDHYRAEREKTKHMEECGQLMSAADFELALSSALKIVAVSLESLPDVLERDAGIDGRAVERCQEVIDRQREELFKRLADA